MPDPNLYRQLQDLGAGDALALALKRFSGLVLGAYETKLVVVSHGVKQALVGAKEYQFPATWKMTAEEHEPGTQLGGNKEPLSEERKIALDTKELVSHNWTPVIDQFIAHFSTQRETAKQAARAIARQLDSRGLRVLILGARQSTRGPNNEFPAGNRLTSPRTAPATTAYPLSLTGSKNLQNDLAEIAQKMDEKDVPREWGMRWAFLTPYLKRVLLLDKTLVSRDYQDPNTMLRRVVKEVEGFIVEETNLMPSTNVTTETNDNYNGDFSKTACCCLGDETAIGRVYAEEITAFGPEWYGDRRAWLIGAASFQGQKWLRPEACAEIQMT